MRNQYQYQAKVKWTGNQGEGTRDYQSYSRELVIQLENKPDILGSSDPAFLGDPTKHNPEDLLISSLSACHMLWYLHLCSQAGIIVKDYQDNATGIMVVGSGGGGRFQEVTLNPAVTVTDTEMVADAKQLHHKAHDLCFIANSINFPIYLKPSIIVKP
ncbi:MAG: OsmC family protein [Sphingobacterium sp.]